MTPEQYRREVEHMQAAAHRILGLLVPESEPAPPERFAAGDPVALLGVVVSRDGELVEIALGGNRTISVFPEDVIRWPNL